jgi:hypothetical protein
MSVLERDIEWEVSRWAIKHGFLAPKVKFVENGWSDRLFIGPRGGLVFIEFKRPGQEPTRLQYFRGECLQNRGIMWEWFDNAAGAIDFLKAILDATSIPGAGSEAPSEPRVGGIILRPRFGKDVDSAGCVPDSEGTEISEEDVDRSSDGSNVQGLAGRDPEMG